jgi:hypothetical protein
MRVVALALALFAQAPHGAADYSVAASELAAKYVEEPAAALALARQLAASPDPAAREVLVHWVHYVLAREFVPVFAANAERTRPLLEALGEWTDVDGMTVHTTAGLRSWVQARRTNDPDSLRRLAQTSYARVESYGGRYRLLLARLLDDREEPDLRLTARRLRERLIDEIYERHRGFPRPEFDQPYGVTHYWVASANAREADLLERDAADALVPKVRQDLTGKANLHSSNAATATRNAVRRPETLWLLEASALAGPEEFLTAAADIHEKTAAEFEAAGRIADAAFQRSQALARSAESALVDGAWIAQFQSVAARLQPERHWAAIWHERVLTSERRFPFASFAIDASQKRWRVVYARNETCRTCGATVQSVQEMALRFPGAVSIVADRELTERTPDVRPSSVPYLIAPDGKYERLSLRHWERMARAFLSVPVDER